ncbi:hypothetical protein EVG20_g6832 [Dentipellis fragilis]|uniref:F-box domain-containing protein n=1 Tax=Dentipellis fragilis TaxID=205917 RepID=A0A4Y9YHQ9_9AGAM|nr:hypothetical protein EVG20_g6832 [Dentipellis fragilis]
MSQAEDSACVEQRDGNGARTLPGVIENLRSPTSIADLPYELLTLIFRELAAVDRPKTVPSPCGNPPVGRLLGWLHITHICRHWRQIALENATLWCKINVNFGHKWAHEMILRSRRAPLAIDYYVLNNAAGDDIRQDILEHISHISSLSIMGESESFLNGLLPRLVEPAPMLTSLTLESLMPVIPSVAPENIFSRISPNLRYLDLINICIPWTSTVFTNLTELYVSIDIESFADFPPPIAYPSVTELLDALDRMPHLEDLQLLGMLPASGLQGPLTRSRRSVSLPELGILQLSGPVLNCAALLHHLEYPVTTGVKIFCICDVSLVHETDAITPMITRHTQARPRYVKVTMRENEYRDPCVSVLSSPWTPTDGHWPNPREQFSMSWTHPGHEHDWTHMLSLLRTFFEVAMLDNIHTLAADGPVDDEQWRSIIGDSCASATEVDVSCDGLVGLLSVLKAVTPVNAFPNIRTLDIREPSLSHLHNVPALEEVMQTFAERKARGMPIQTLDISSWRHNPEWVEAVKAIVPIVKYNAEPPA